MADHPSARAAAAFAGFLAITLALTWPLVTVLGTSLPSDAGDPVLNTWILWWNSQAVPLTRAWWQAPAFYPAQGVLAFSEHLLGLAWIAVPIERVSGNPVFAYNVAFILSFALSGWAAYLLAFELTRRRDAAWAGGMLYAFCAYRVDQLPHLQVLSSYGMPLALFALHRFLRDSRRRWLALFVVAFVQQGLSNGYYLLYFPVLLALWAAWFLPSQWDWQRARALGIAAAAAAALVAPILWQYRAILGAYGLSRTMNGLVVYGADITSLFSAPDRLRLWRFLDLSDRAEGRLFPGVTAPLLILLAFLRARPRSAVSVPRGVRRTRRAILILLAMYAAVLLVRLAAGPITLGAGALELSIARVDKLLAIVLYLAAAAWLLTPRVIAAWRRARPLPFYAMAAGVMWVLALGPDPTWFGTQAIAGAPYRWLLHLPGYDGLRVSGRFWMLGVLCLSAASALAIARLVAPGTRRAGVAAALVTLGALTEAWVGAMPVVPAPRRSPLLEASARHPVLELPMGSQADVAAMYRGMYHGQPVANGFSGYEPEWYSGMRSAAARRDPALLARAASQGIRDVRVDRAADEGGSLERFVAGYPGVRVIGESADEILFRLPAIDARDRPE